MNTGLLFLFTDGQVYLLLVSLALQPIVVVFSQPGSGL
jgi:hypothetical protein